MPISKMPMSRSPCCICCRMRRSTTLDEVLALLKRYHARAYLEFKSAPPGPVLEKVGEAGLLEQVLFWSFNRDFLIELRQLSADADHRGEARHRTAYTPLGSVVRIADPRRLRAANRRSQFFVLELCVLRSQCEPEAVAHHQHHDREGDAGRHRRTLKRR